MLFFSAVSGNSFANEWANDVAITQVNTYQSGTGHFVWFTALPSEFKTESPSTPIMQFDESQPGGKSMLAMIMTALVNKRKVNVQASGCKIVEIYLK
ncbi:hypothetical protein KHF85_19585 [Xanthomonas translucens pv. graminis]|uniref:hypothetical protein n=1 Tax=Xanthomonas graminis TaxID=3390026 RepID=UPI0025403B45|nr:hypothetical protein [Xanthomonas translucens]WIH04916.1 hypothetical protein KHF85_19585 [Xanthomonas translucens pv. graminis]